MSRRQLNAADDSLAVAAPEQPVVIQAAPTEARELLVHSRGDGRRRAPGLLSDRPSQLFRTSCA